MFILFSRCLEFYNVFLKIREEEEVHGVGVYLCEVDRVAEFTGLSAYCNLGGDALILRE